jgi:LL-diaminopimelate aminotransferase
MKEWFSQRLRSLPPYLFAEIDRIKSELREKGARLFDLTIGDPDLPTPKRIISALKEAVEDPKHHRYPPYRGTEEFREAVSLWYRKRFGVDLDPQKEVLALIGSKEGIAHLPLALSDPGDVVLYTEPGYPVYGTTPTFFQARPYPVPLREENHFLPDLDAIPARIRNKAKIFFVNYPNNPTGVRGKKEFYEELIAFAHRYGILIAHDAAYSEIYEGEPPPSILSFEGSKEVAVEFHSLSKTFNMTGWRLGMVVGNPSAISALGVLKTHLDSGVFTAIQRAGTVALQLPEEELLPIRRTYMERKRQLTSALEKAGITVIPSDTTFYIWAKVPNGFTSEGFVKKLLLDAHVAVTPGIGFGPDGEAYFRISVTAPNEEIEEAGERIAQLSL